jgi:hypothetical protein
VHVPVDDLYLYIMLGCAHEQKAHGGRVDRIKTQCCNARGPYVTIRTTIKHILRRFCFA